jgi:hypothetical protein
MKITIRAAPRIAGLFITALLLLLCICNAAELRAQSPAQGQPAIPPPPASNVKILSVAPNPFRVRTTVKYTLTNSAHITIGIFDVNGREIHRLIEEEQKEGAHEVEIPASVFETSGNYYCSIVSDEDAPVACKIALER